MAGTTDRVVETLARLNHFAHTREQEEKPAPITIALSRQAGARGVEIARAVGERLGWPVYDNELLETIAREKGMHTGVLERLDERYLGWLEESVRNFTSQKDGYLMGLLELLAALSKVGHSVIVGRGSPHALPPETTLRVRVIASRPARVVRVQASQGLSAAEAERWIDRTERERLRFVDHYFHADAASPLAYDLVLNSERLGVQECAALIAQEARTMETRVPARPLSRA